MIWVIIAITCLFGFMLAVITGAPYVPVFYRDAEDLIASLGSGDGKKFVDLGCGDGKVLLIAAKRGYDVVGYEINPVLWFVCILRTWPYRNTVRIKLSSFWRADLTDCDVVFVFLIDRFMPKLEQKMQLSRKNKRILISYVFALPNKKPYQTTRNAYFYRF